MYRMLDIIIGVFVWLVVAGATFIFYRKFSFSEDKLYRKKYDEYGFSILIIGIACVYLVKKLLADYLILQVFATIIALCTVGIAAAFLLKQTIYDYKNRRFPFQRR